MAVRLSLIGLFSLALLLTPAVVSAQYPPPDGNVTLTSAEPISALGSTTTVTVTVVDSSGGAVAGAVCTAQIASQPGDSASVAEPTVTTGADGKASVDVSVGDSAGQVTVLVTCGDLQSSAVLSVGVAPAPPDTGSGDTSTTTDSPTSTMVAGILTLGVVLLTGVVGGGVIARRRRGT